jgi:hypothetical protein
MIDALTQLPVLRTQRIGFGGRPLPHRVAPCLQEPLGACHLLGRPRERLGVTPECRNRLTADEVNFVSLRNGKFY